jgi:hypothetical protein
MTATRISHGAAGCLITAILFVAVTGLIEVAIAAQQPATPEGTGFQSFDRAVTDYMALHAKLRSETPGPVPQSSAKEVTNASDLLANSIRRARPRASQGQFFDKAVAEKIRARIKDTLSSSRIAIASIDDERPRFQQPSVYLRFPAASEMATMPPSILQVLPVLPPELEYRIVGEYLVLRDVKAALVLDFIPRAVPRSGQ